MPKQFDTEKQFQAYMDDLFDRTIDHFEGVEGCDAAIICAHIAGHVIAAADDMKSKQLLMRLVLEQLAQSAGAKIAIVREEMADAQAN